MSDEIPGAQEPYNAGEELVVRAARRAGERLLRWGGRDCSGTELGERVLGAQRTLLAKGLRPGERVLLLIRDTPAFYAGFLGALRGGLIPIPISTTLPPKDVAFIARDAAISAAVLDDALPAAIRDASLFPNRAHLLEAHGGELAEEAPGPDPEVASTLGGDPAFWLYTSGTTGEPKGVVHRHLDLAATARCYASEILSLGPGDRVLSAAKLFFAYGLGNSLTFPLLLDAEAVVHPERPTPEAMFELLEREEPSVFFGVPTLYASMLAHPELPPELPGLRLCVSAGEALPPVLFERWRERFGVEILDGLGSTEMLHIFLSNRLGSARPGSSGTPVPGYEVRIVDEGGDEVDPEQVGSLLAFGPSAALRYHDRPEQTARTMFAPGWLRTGDSYRRDQDGYHFHVGRSDDLMKVSGQWVSPVEVEATLAEHPSVLEAAVVAAADANQLTRPKAYVVLRSEHPSSETLASDLQSFVKDRLAPHKYPRWVEFVDSLPKTQTGKIQRFALRKGAP